MKWVPNISISLLVFAGFISCEPAKKNDSNKVAEEKNDEKFDTRTGEKEAEFVTDVIADNYAEIKLAELASTKSSNKEVQEFAQTLVNDHTNALTEFQDLAGQKGITVPVEEREAAKEKVNDLAKEGAPDFDKKWCDAVADNHKKIIRLYEIMQEKSEDPQLKEVINKTLPDLRAHLDKLNTIEKIIM
jgi:putative membrane protein